MRNFILVLVVALLFSSAIYFLISKSEIAEVNIQVTQETYDESVYKQTIENLGKETKVNVDTIYKGEIGRVETKNSLLNTLEDIVEPEVVEETLEKEDIVISSDSSLSTVEEETETSKPFRIVTLEEFISGGETK